ncbi:MAG: DUF5683 domain-containing protein [Tannerellaceae bacterium]|nr:DUF5683 domain-containing protein [Tannerellaceae bacterium]MCD8263376.1 DUF5683 domain-containing protein [Tannerellaceae bacterium]
MKSGLRKWLSVWIFLMGCSGVINAQEIWTDIPNVPMDTIQVMSPNSTVGEIVAAADSVFTQQELEMELPANVWKPNSTRAVIYSAIFPGLGQIYNKQYWKLPIVYGGFMGCLYAVTWNNKNYKDYRDAYFDIERDRIRWNALEDDKKDSFDPKASWTVLLPSSTSVESALTSTTFSDNLKRRKDYFRRYRDLSILITVGVYAICIIDAYIDAELFDFDISPDLTMRVEPVVTPKTSYSSRTVGVSWSMNF